MNVIKVLGVVGAVIAIANIADEAITIHENKDAIKRTFNRLKNFIFKKKEEPDVEVVVDVDENGSTEDIDPKKDAIITIKSISILLLSIWELKTCNRMILNSIIKPIKVERDILFNERQLWKVAYYAQLDSMKAFSPTIAKEVVPSV